ncbi:murein hydrolase activator EnvC family protein [Flavobacterium sp. I3-2]|uniref:murein hydrolase activator EnvC family protein n=1 Tax=Flavobacterium sp. I3-2 TaxID=2748319 RepID=UPI0015ACF442|nr:peptidoglycan DD-metalloendopeptidase family protein [Flavobacterium sp. I3-2]
MQRILLILVTFFITISSYSQDYEEQQRKLENRKAQILKEIKEVQTLLNSEKKKERNIFNEITNQNKKIKLSTELINNSQKQNRVLSDDIYTATLQSNKLKRELKVLQADYAKTIVKSYKTRSEQSRILFILSSDNFLQAYKRMQYMKQYANFRKTQGDEIKEKTIELQELTKRLEIQKVKQQAILAEQEKERKVLEDDKKIQNQLLAEVKKDQKKYDKQIRDKQAESKKIDREIKAVIQKAIAEANRKAKEKAEKERLAKEKATGKKETPTKTSTVSSTKFDLTPEEKTLSNSFKTNRGRLPWPVEKGFISMKYGDQPLPGMPNVTVHNSGVEITTESGSSVRAVFEGEVFKIQNIGNIKLVYIRHGEYVSIYQNLSSISVSDGQKVSTKQKIGTISNNHEGKAVLKFVISQNDTFMNPESWISTK